MRLTPKDGVSHGALWLATAARQSRIQINSLSFGSVVDQVNPGDVERIILPRIDDEAATSAAEAWDQFADAGRAMRRAITLLEAALSSGSGVEQSFVA